MGSNPTPSATTRPNGLDRVKPWIWAAILCGAGLVAGAALVWGGPGFGDEFVHSPQIRQLQEGNPKILPGLTTFPGYHVAVAALLRPTGYSGLHANRVVSLGVSVAMMLVFAFFVSRSTPAGSAAFRVTQLAFLPILFPFLFLVYTDVPSLLLVLLAAAWADKPRPILAPLAALLAVLVRQTNIVWLPFIAALQLAARSHQAKVHREPPIGRGERFAHLAPYVLIALQFVGFVWIHGDVALGDATAHPVGPLHTANPLFFLFVFLVCFLPLHLSRLPRLTELSRSPGRVAALVGLGVVLWLVLAGSFAVDHPYNANMLSLRNRVLAFFDQGWPGRLTLSATSLASLLSLCATRVRRPVAYLLVPLTVVFLAGHWLVEQRYYLVPMAFWLAYREDAPVWAERLQVVYGVGLSLLLLAGIVHGRFFL